MAGCHESADVTVNLGRRVSRFRQGPGRDRADEELHSEHDLNAVIAQREQRITLPVNEITKWHFGNHNSKDWRAIVRKLLLSLGLLAASFLTCSIGLVEICFRPTS